MSPKILIASDDPVQRRLLETLVHQFGYRAETVESGVAVLARLQISGAAPVDLIILDLVTPNLDGMAVLSQVAGAKRKTSNYRADFAGNGRIGHPGNASGGS